jgi:hypothetical protein
MQQSVVSLVVDDSIPAVVVFWLCLCVLGSKGWGPWGCRVELFFGSVAVFSLVLPLFSPPSAGGPQSPKKS